MALTCRKVCAGKKKSIMYEQCRDEEGKIAKMRRIGNCDAESDYKKDVKYVDG